MTRIERPARAITATKTRLAAASALAARRVRHRRRGCGRRRM